MLFLLCFGFLEVSCSLPCATGLAFPGLVSQLKILGASVASGLQARYLRDRGARYLGLSAVSHNSKHNQANKSEKPFLSD